MTIIGEKLNSSLPETEAAILSHDTLRIQALALEQMKAGADFLDLCTSSLENEEEALWWMIEQVQAVTDVPLCLDSPVPQVLRNAARFCRRPGMLNSIAGGDAEEVRQMSAFLKENPGWMAVLMLRRADSLPESAKERLEILEECLETAASCGISQEQLCIDPMVQAAAFLDTEEGEAPAGVMLETIRKIREKYEKLHIVGAISNISYGLPARRYVNQSFAVLAQQAGIDCMILNPLDTELQSVLAASQMLLGLDGEPCCMGYVRSFRKNQQLKNS